MHFIGADTVLSYLRIERLKKRNYCQPNYPIHRYDQSRKQKIPFTDFGLIIQTTSVGMNFAQEGMPLNPKNVSEGTIVADIIYNPLETEFLAEARKRGA